MRYEHVQIKAAGQKTGPAILHEYILDPNCVVPEKKRPAVVVCAGGSYRFRSLRESEPVIMQFLAMGYHAFLLDYSVAPNRFPTALLELAEAVAIIREHGSEWNVNQEGIYVCGFSAGGHLAASLGTFWNRGFVSERLHRSPREIRPDGMIIAYAPLSAGEFGHRESFEKLLGEEACAGEHPTEAEKFVSLETQVTKDTPRAFIWHTWEDTAVPPENCLVFADALRKNGVNFELHIYSKGVHGLALANDETSGQNQALNMPSVQNWVDMVHKWIECGQTC